MRDFHPTRRSRLKRALVTTIAAVALATGATVVLTPKVGHGAAAVNLPELGSESRAQNAAEYPRNGSFAPLVQKASPAVVSIQSERIAEAPQMPEGFPFFGPNSPFNIPIPQQPQERRQRGMGSGVIIGHEGYILTNHHVVADADKVSVMLADNREFEAEVLGSDPKTDIAVVKVEASDLPVLPLGNSESVQVGDIVLAIGNPFGLGQTVTMGIVGATGREFGIMAAEQGYEDFIQTDAAINPGNSGGALINTNGEVIGINTAILSRSGGNNGVGFAVPINLAHYAMTQLVEKGRVVRGYMGVGIQPVTPELSKAFNTPDTQGALVRSVEPGGPAAEAGIEQGDVIRELNGQPVEDVRELRLAVARVAPGKQVEVTVLRNGDERTVDLKLGELPGEEAPRQVSQGEKSPLEGVNVQDLTPQLQRRLQLPDSVSGVVVTQVNPSSPAARAGLRPGDVIEQVNRQPIESVAQFREQLQQTGDGSTLLLVNSGGNSRFVVIES